MQKTNTKPEDRKSAVTPRKLSTFRMSESHLFRCAFEHWLVPDSPHPRHIAPPFAPIYGGSYRRTREELTVYGTGSLVNIQNNPIICTAKHVIDDIHGASLIPSFFGQKIFTIDNPFIQNRFAGKDPENDKIDFGFYPLTPEQQAECQTRHSFTPSNQVVQSNTEFQSEGDLLEIYGYLEVDNQPTRKSSGFVSLIDLPKPTVIYGQESTAKHEKFLRSRSYCPNRHILIPLNTKRVFDLSGTKGFYQLPGTGIAGMSGGPIFRRRNNRLYFYGMTLEYHQGFSIGSSIVGIRSGEFFHPTRTKLSELTSTIPSLQ